jgi:hypothetical protein
MQSLMKLRFLILLGAGLALGMSDANAQSPNSMAASERTDVPEPAGRARTWTSHLICGLQASNGTVGALDHETSVHVTARDVLSNFNFGLMGAVETRYNRIIIPVDFM